MGELIDLSSELEVVKKSGAWYAYEGEKRLVKAEKTLKNT